MAIYRCREGNTWVFKAKCSEFGTMMLDTAQHQHVNKYDIHVCQALEDGVEQLSCFAGLRKEANAKISYSQELKTTLPVAADPVLIQQPVVQPVVQPDDSGDMPWALILILALGYFLFRKKSNKSPVAKVLKSSSLSSRKPPRSSKKLEGKSSWVKARWAGIQADKDNAICTGLAPKWYFDEMTERQEAKLEDLGIDVDPCYTKGQASDLIGISYPADDEDLAVLKFFKISTVKMNQSRARHEVAILFQNPENISKWEGRGAEAMQKEFFRFHGLKLPKGLKHDQAEELIRKHAADLDDNAAEEWDAYECFYDELCDPDFRELYDIRKVPLNVYREAVATLKNEGLDVKKLDEDEDAVIDKILELKPELAAS